MKAFHNKDGKPVLMRMVSGIKENKDYLGEIDGLIGDGDHGMNMNKGFSLFQQRFEKETFDLSEGLRELGMIYGTVFMAMADEADGKDEITVSDLYQMLDQAKKELEELVGARTGDKTLMDTLTPAVAALEKAGQEGADMQTALVQMKKAAESGRDSTKDMIAKFGRASRLGERSRGVLDAGAVSCCILLQSFADGIMEVIG